jgi:glycosyltransferase involved in cell wall biosynthesis
LKRLDPRLLTEDGRPESIAAGILAFRNDLRPSPSRACQWSERCRRFAAAHFSWERHIDALEALLTRRPLRGAPPPALPVAT